LKTAKQPIEDPSVYIPYEKKLTSKILREVLKWRAAELTAWTTTKFRKALAEIILKEEAIKCVMREGK
jgi:hypothetical protein